MEGITVFVLVVLLVIGGIFYQIFKQGFRSAKVRKHREEQYIKKHGL